METEVTKIIMVRLITPAKIGKSVEGKSKTTEVMEVTEASIEEEMEIIPGSDMKTIDQNTILTSVSNIRGENSNKIDPIGMRFKKILPIENHFFEINLNKQLKPLVRVKTLKNKM